DPFSRASLKKGSGSPFLMTRAKRGPGALFARVIRKGLPDPFFRPADQPLAHDLELLELLQAAYLPGALVALELAPVVERRRDLPAERVDVLARQQQRIQQLGVANEPLRRQIA